MYNNDKLLEVLEAYLVLKTRIVLDDNRNKLFKFLDKHSKKLDNLAEIKIRNFDMRQYAMFRDITEMQFYPVDNIGTPFKRDEKTQPLNFEPEDTCSFWEDWENY